MSSARSRTVRWKFALVLALALLLLAEVGSRVVLGVFAGRFGDDALPASERLALHADAAERLLARRPEAFAVYDRALGWRPRPGTANGLDHINRIGVRSKREYAAAKPRGVVRVSVFGDSFVYGSETLGRNSWPGRLEALDPHTEVLNYGVPGYGPDQALLRFEAEASAMQPDWVLLGTNPIAAARLVSVTSAFRQPRSDSFTKPRFRLDDAGELVLVPNPISRLDDVRSFGTREGMRALGADDYWYRPSVYQNPLHDWLGSVRLVSMLWDDVLRRHLDPDRPLVGPPGAARLNAESTSFRIMTGILRRFVEGAEKIGARAAVVVLPDEYSLASAKDGGVAICDPLIDWCAEHGVSCWDAKQALLPLPEGLALAEYFKGSGHYRLTANERVARFVDAKLREADRSGP